MTPLIQSKITNLIIYHCAIPVNRPRDHGVGRVADKVEVVILRLQTEDGVVGWGEASPWAVFTGTCEATFAALERYLAPVVMGSSPADIPTIMRDADRQLVGHPEAKAALETALLDCAGRVTGLPVWALLGGRYRDKIPLSVSLADPDFKADLALAQRLRDDKIGIVKLKTGVKDHAFDLMRLQQLREDFPEFDVRIDFNQGLAAFGAIKKLRDMESFDVTFIEQPVQAHNREAMAEITAALDTPVLADESVFTITQAYEAVRDGICNGMSVKIMKHGGLRKGLEVAAIAESAGLSCYGGDMFETGIAHLAGAHMIAAAPNISLGCEFYQAKYYLEQDLLAQPFPIKEGHVVVPDAPGLGVDVDENKVKAFAVRQSEVIL